MPPFLRETNSCKAQTGCYEYNSQGKGEGEHDRRAGAFASSLPLPLPVSGGVALEGTQSTRAFRSGAPAQ